MPGRRLGKFSTSCRSESIDGIGFDIVAPNSTENDVKDVHLDREIADRGECDARESVEMVSHGLGVDDLLEACAIVLNEAEKDHGDLTHELEALRKDKLSHKLGEPRLGEGLHHRFARGACGKEEGKSECCCASMFSMFGMYLVENQVRSDFFLHLIKSYLFLRCRKRRQ